MLTLEERTTLRERCRLLSLQGLERLAVHCAKENRPDAAKYVRDLIAERDIQNRANAVPFEVAGQRRRESAPAQDGPQQVAYPTYWSSDRIRYIGAAVAGISGFGAAIYYVVIPVMVALFSAVVSVVSLAAPYVAGGILAVIVIREAFFGEKKTGSFPAESPKPSGGNVYNIYIGEGQNVHVHSAEK